MFCNLLIATMLGAVQPAAAAEPVHTPAAMAAEIDWLRLPPARVRLGAQGQTKPMGWAALGALLGGAVLPSVGNTVYLLDRNGSSWESAQQAIDEPLLLLWANTWLFGAVGPVSCSTGALLLYLGADGPPSQGFGGWIVGTLTGIANLPVGVLLGTAAVRLFKDVLWGPGWVYGTYSGVTFTTTALGGLVGFNLAGGRLPEDTSSRFRAAPSVLAGDDGPVNGWMVSGRF